MKKNIGLEKKIVMVFGGKEFQPTTEVFYGKNNEIWILGVHLGTIPEYHKIFELHHPNTLRNIYGDGNIEKKIIDFEIRHAKEIKKDSIILGHENKNIKTYELYPWDDIIKKYGTYLTNSIVLMLLYAFEKGHHDIEIYGLYYSTEREMELEKRNTEYWIGYLTALGCNIKVHDHDTLCHCDYIYGLEDDYIQRELIRIKKYKELNQKMYDYNCKQSNGIENIDENGTFELRKEYYKNKYLGLNWLEERT